MGLSKVVSTHHTLKNQGRQPMGLNHDGSYKRPPIDAAGSGSMQEKQRVYPDEIISRAVIRDDAQASARTY